MLYDCFCSCYFVYLGHSTLSKPILLVGVQYGGHAQNMISLYAHLLIYLCTIISILDPEQFNRIEKVILQNLLCGAHWSSFMAADILCFIAR